MLKHGSVTLGVISKSMATYQFNASTKTNLIKRFSGYKEATQNNLMYKESFIKIS